MPMATIQSGSVALLALFVALQCLQGAAGETLNLPMHHLALDGDAFSGRPQERSLASSTAWCIAKPNLDNSAYQGALDWVCGPLPNQGNVNCGPIQSGQSCYLPNTYQDHASWAFNSYFQMKSGASSACDFQGAAQITNTDPSTATCPYPGSNGTYTGVFGSNPSSSYSAAHEFEPRPLVVIISPAVALVAYLLAAQAL